MNPAFDTHKAVKDLTNAGADEKLAEATVATISTAINEQVATKSDLEVVQVNLKSDIKAVQDNLKSDIKAVQDNLKSDIKAVQDKLEHVQEELKDVWERMATKADLEILSKSMTIRLGLMLFAAFAAMVALFNATN